MKDGEKQGNRKHGREDGREGGDRMDKRRIILYEYME
jgi:hypothetical protein